MKNALWSRRTQSALVMQHSDQECFNISLEPTPKIHGWFHLGRYRIEKTRLLLYLIGALACLVVILTISLISVSRSTSVAQTVPQLKPAPQEKQQNTSVTSDLSSEPRSAEHPESTASMHTSTSSPRQEQTISGEKLPESCKEIMSSTTKELPSEYTESFTHAPVKSHGGVNSSFSVEQKDPDVCLSQDCIQQAATMLQYRNESMPPCQNFYQHACGRFGLFEHAHGADSKHYDVIDMLADRNAERLKSHLDKQYPEGTAFNKASAYYASCMQEIYTYNNLHELKKLINSLGGMDLFGSWNESNYDLNKTLGLFAGDLQVISLFDLQVENQKLIVTSPNLNYHRSRINHSVLFHNATKPQYEKRSDYKYILRLRKEVLPVVRLLSNISVCKPSCYHKVFRDIVYIEKHILTSKYTKLYSNQPGNLQNLQNMAGNIDWNNVVAQTYGSNFSKTNPDIQYIDLDYIERLMQLVNITDKKVIHHYMMWCLIRTYLSTIGPLYSSTDRRSIWWPSKHSRDPVSRSEYCIEKLEAEMRPVTSALLMQEHIEGEKLQSVRELAENLKKVIRKTIDTVSNSSDGWFVKFVDDIKVDFGLENWTDSTLDDCYNSVSMNMTNLFHNTLQLNRLKVQQTRDQLSGTGNSKCLSLDENLSQDFTGFGIKYDSKKSVMTVNYLLLQLPLFSVHIPGSINAAALGSLITSQMAHWMVVRKISVSRMLPRIISRYLKCLSTSFLNVWKAKHPNNQSISITIDLFYAEELGFTHPLSVLADHFAMRTSFELLKSVPANSVDVKLPGLPDLSPEQLFFMSFAQTRCHLPRPYYIGYHGLDPSPEMIINTLAFKNDNFKKAFRCEAVPAIYENTRKCEL